MLLQYKRYRSPPCSSSLSLWWLTIWVVERGHLYENAMFTRMEEDYYLPFWKMFESAALPGVSTSFCLQHFPPCYSIFPHVLIQREKKKNKRCKCPCAWLNTCSFFLPYIPLPLETYLTCVLQSTYSTSWSWAGRLGFFTLKASKWTWLDWVLLSPL